MTLVRLTDTQSTAAQEVLAAMTLGVDPDARITDDEAQALHRALGVGVHESADDLPLPPQIVVVNATPNNGPSPLGVTVSATAIAATSWELIHPEGTETTPPPWDIEIIGPRGAYTLYVIAMNDYGADVATPKVTVT